jgi:(1->4)-alpha-D-glucan 1-alpha-D-glucosylmutase
VTGAGLGATYRLQVQAIGLARAKDLVAYLDRLGIGTLYLSPVFTAAPGSGHGYDVADPDAVDPALGGRQGLEVLLACLDERGMGALVDVVPNHMGAVETNRWWWDVLRRGRASAYAEVFDIDWSAGGGRVLLPVLGAPVGEVVRAGELTVGEEDGEPVVAYHDRRFPLAEGSGVPTAAGPLSETALLELLDEQHYRLGYWRLGPHELNYRRFFDIDSLVGVRVEDEGVYRRTHRLVLELAGDPRVRGLRVDHVDGLADPGGYLARLRRDLAARRPQPAGVVVEKILARGEALPGWEVDGTTGYEFADVAGGLFVQAAGARAMAKLADELSPGSDDGPALARQGRREVACRLFPGQLGRVCRALHAAAAAEPEGRDLLLPAVERAVVALLGRFGVYRAYVEGGRVPEEGRRRIADAAAGARAELDVEAVRALEAVVRVVSLRPAGGADDGTGGPVAAWEAVARHFGQLASAVAAKGVEDTALYRFAGLLSAAEVGGEPAAPAVEPAAFHAAMRARAGWGPGSLNATSTHDSKRSEDVRCRIAVLSEVPDRWLPAVRKWHRREARSGRGGDPVVPWDVEHAVYQTLVGAWPLLESEWEGFADRVEAFARKHVREQKLRTSWTDPDPAFEEAVVEFLDRLLRRERGAAFRGDMDRLVARLAPAGCAAALALVTLKVASPGVPDLYQGDELWAPSLVDPDNRRPVDFGARLAALEQVEQALGDAAGRRPDPAVAVPVASEAMRAWRDGRIKLLVTRQLLHARRAEPELFASGDYVPVEVHGRARRHVVAFARRRGDAWALAAVPRLAVALCGTGVVPVGEALWAGTTLVLPEGAPEQFVHVVTGEPAVSRRGAVPLSSLFSTVPLALALAS